MSKIINNWDRFANAKVCVMTGERRQESRNRATYNEVDVELTQKRQVIQWRPIIDWTEKEVWDIMEAHKVQPHPCYEMGWGRCSCQLCIFGMPDTWASIEEISPRKVARIAAIEQDFKAKGEAIIEAEKADPSLIKIRPKKDKKTKKFIKDENGKPVMEPKPFTNVPYLYGDEDKKTGERMDLYQSRVDKGKSFIKEENKKRWMKEALGTFTSPIIVENWKLPAGAFSSRTEGAS
jgi:3'-phosphoadenosine 5'-phosphosulfate sulfotransferase (PAPS reductase)/FAD synthetase